MAAPPADPELTVELARSAVAEIAPEELPLFAATSAAYRRDPGAIDGARGRDEVLGFGAETAAALAPVALSVAGAVVEFVAGQVMEAVKGEAAGAIQRAVKRLFRLGGDEDEQADPPPRLSAEQLQQVRAVALERAKALQLPARKAELLADALVGRLATG
jgi:hypothetical protein